MSEARVTPAPSLANLRWRILRRFLIPGANAGDDNEITKISRVPSGSFGFFKVRRIGEERNGDNVLLEYSIPEKCPPLLLRQGCNDGFKLNDYSTNRQLGVDNTGVICLWPAEEVLAYYCLKHPEMFKNKRVLELGAGYGLAGLALAASSEAAEVLLTDGNPKVVEYIEKNITLNNELFGNTKVRASVLYWSNENSSLEPGFDIIIAADCTYFKDFHSGLAHTISCMLSNSGGSQALLLCPRRGRSLEEFLDVAKAGGLIFSVNEKYDDDVWRLSNEFSQKMNKKWSNYDQEHNYPLYLEFSR